MVAIGGWGDTSGFDTAARTGESRARFARNVADMVHDTGADGELATAEPTVAIERNHRETGGYETDRTD